MVVGGEVVGGFQFELCNYWRPRKKSPPSTNHPSTTLITACRPSVIDHRPSITDCLSKTTIFSIFAPVLKYG
jgi:hypothetical protein